MPSAALAMPRSQASFKGDRTPPSIAFSSLRQGQTVTYLRVLGWVRDNPGGSGISRVIVRLQRRTRGRTFKWHGYGWFSHPDLPKEDWWYFADLSGSRWSYHYIPSRNIQIGGHGTPQYGPDLFSGIYKFTATAYDRAGNSKSIAMSVRVIADKTLPAVGFSRPRSGTVIRALPVISGFARDKGGSGLESLYVSIWRHSDNKWWTGTVWTRMQFIDPPRLPAVLSRSRWRIVKDLPKGANLPDGEYSLWAVAYDRAGNRSGLRWFRFGKQSSGVDDQPATANVRVRRTP
jgi:hypothetical protein